MKIGNINIDNGLVLAPMEGVTDLPFRILCKQMGADLVYTEFIASDAIVRDVEKSFNKMKIVEKERPVAVQIFGANPNAMARSAQIIEDSGADIVDINFGCWVKRVVTNNAGAAFLKAPHKMAHMVETVVKSVSIPVTAKTRIGWDSDSIIIEDVAQMMEQAGVSALAIHCRTRAQGMQGHADWSWIPKVKEKVSIPIILNGDVTTPREAKKAFDQTGCDAVMIGRAAVGNPFIFRYMKDYLEKGTEEKADVRERIDTCLIHLRLNMDYKNGQKGLLQFRKHYSGYLKGLHNGSLLRQKLVLSESFDEIKEMLEEFYDFLVKEDRLYSHHEKFEAIKCPMD